MARKRSSSAQGPRPPELPTELTTRSTPATLDDEEELSAALLVDADLSTTSAADVSLDQVVLRRVRLAQVELVRPLLTDVQFDTCDLAGATLTKPQLRRIALLGCRLLGAAFLEARIDDMLIQRGNGEALRCWNSTLRAVRFERCALRGASFTGSDLSDVVFRGCDLSGADLRDTTLRGADLRGSTLTGLQVGLGELQGAIVSPSQAVELAQLLGLAVVAEDNDT